MKAGRRWLAFDADFMHNPLTKQIRDEFGDGGVSVWTAFLCACKTSPTPGQIRFTSEVQLLQILGLSDPPPAGLDGSRLDLDALWTLLGRVKQASRRRHGGYTYLRSTRYEDWQKTARTDNERERKRRWRAQNGRDINGTDAGHGVGHVPSNVPLENEKEKERIFPPTPQRGEQAPSAHASPPPTPATPKPPCAACGEPAYLVDQGANLCLACYEHAVVVPVKTLS